jgi:hypothetical protein
MAVRAPDLAVSDLLRDARPWSAAGHERADEFALLADVVEVEHPDIRLAAVDARVVAQILAEMRLRGGDAPAAGGDDLAQMRRAAAREVVPEALAAPVLETGSGPVEGRDRQITSAATAGLASEWHEHMFVYAPDGLPV